MKTNIYLVNYDDNTAAFSSKEKANKFMERFNLDTIEEIELDSTKIKKLTERKTDVYFVRMTWDGAVIDAWDIKTIDIKPTNNGLVVYGTKFLYSLKAFDTYCLALNKEHAIKLANKRRLFLLKKDFLSHCDISKISYYNFKTRKYKTVDCDW